MVAHVHDAGVIGQIPELPILYASLNVGGESNIRSRLGPLFDAGREVAFDLPTSEIPTASFFKTRQLAGRTYIAAATSADDAGNTHTAQVESGNWHTLGQSSTQLIVTGTPNWISTLAQALAMEPNLPAFAVGVNREGLVFKTRIVAADAAQNRLTLETPLIFDASNPGFFTAAFALPDSLNTGANPVSDLIITGSEEFGESQLGAMSSLFVDNPDMDGNTATNDPYVRQDVENLLRFVSDNKLESGAKVGTIFYNDPRMWELSGIKVQFHEGHYGHFTAQMSPPPLTREIPAALVSPVQEILNITSDISTDFGDASELDQSIPGLDDTSISDLVNPGESFQNNVADKVQNFFMSTSEPTVDGLLKSIGGGSSLDTIAASGFRQEGSQFLLDIHYSDEISHPLPIDLGFGAGTGSLPFDLHLNANLIGQFTFDFTLGIDLLSISDLDQALFIQVHEVSARALVETFDLNVGLNLGFLEAAVQNGRVQLEAKVNAIFQDPNLDGRITLGELRNTAFTDLVDLSLTGAVDANLPIKASLGSFTTSVAAPPTIQVIDTNLFDSTLPAVSFQNFDQILDFSSFDADSILAMLRSLAARLKELGSSSAFNFEIPFTGKRIGDAVDLGLDFVDLLANVQGDPTFSGAQSLATQLATALGVDPSIVNPQFNPATRELTYTIDYSKMVNASTGFAFNTDLAPVADISATGNLAFAGSVDFDMTFGVDISPVSARITGTADAPASGNFSGEAIFQLTLGGDAPVEVRFFGTGNATLDDLIVDINAALATAGLASKVKAERSGNKLQLRTTQITATPTLRITASASNPAVTALHLPRRPMPLTA